MSAQTWILGALLTGIVIPVQIGINAAMGRWAGHPSAGVAVNFTTGLLWLGIYLALARPPLAPLTHWFGAPWYFWSGGLIGALIVSSGLVVAPRLGAATFMGLLVAGQLLGSMTLDHFGWLGFPRIPFSFTRLAGAGLLVAGVVLIRRG